MILYVVSGGPSSGKTTLARDLAGASNVWDLCQSRHRCQDTYFATLSHQLEIVKHMLAPKVALDDPATVEEVQFIRRAMGDAHTVVHFHIVNGNNPLGDDESLRAVAKYVIEWGD